MATTQGIEFKDPAVRAMESAEELRDMQGEKMVLNLGPSHPATHGCCASCSELDEIITRLCRGLFAPRRRKSPRT
jgi:NADH-quinone oxidoreductase subunit D